MTKFLQKDPYQIAYYVISQVILKSHNLSYYEGVVQVMPGKEISEGDKALLEQAAEAIAKASTGMKCELKPEVLLNGAIRIVNGSGSFSKEELLRNLLKVQEISTVNNGLNNIWQHIEKVLQAIAAPTISLPAQELHYNNDNNQELRQEQAPSPVKTAIVKG